MMEMTQYIGTKLINAKPMSREDYVTLRGWTLPADENGEDAGYLVEYVEGGKANTEMFKKYVSWCPAEVFNHAYRPVKGLSFSQALEAVKAGQKIARNGWNGKSQYVYLVTGVHLATVLSNGDGDIVGVNDLLVLINEQKKLASWVPSIGDLMADDWYIVE